MAARFATTSKSEERRLIRELGLCFLYEADAHASGRVRPVIQRLADHVGVKIDWDLSPICGRRGSSLVLAYDGKVIAAKDRSTSNIIHDIAHFICAAKRRRRLPNFGLGGSPDDFAGDGDSPLVVSDAYAQAEEENASLLGILVEAHLGVRFTETLVDHTWEDEKQVQNGLTSLRKKGFVRGVTPVICEEMSLPPMNVFDKELINDYRSVR